MCIRDRYAPVDTLYVLELLEEASNRVQIIAKEHDIENEAIITNLATSYCYAKKGYKKISARPKANEALHKWRKACKILQYQNKLVCWLSRIKDPLDSKKLAHTNQHLGRINDLRMLDQLIDHNCTQPLAHRIFNTIKNQSYDQMIRKALNNAKQVFTYNTDEYTERYL